MIDNHGHIGTGHMAPEDVVEGYNPEEWFGHSPGEYLSLMDAVGIERAVVHCPRPWANKYFGRILRENPSRFASVCKLDEATVTTEAAKESLRVCVEEWGFKGLYYDAGPDGNDAACRYHTERYVPFWKYVEGLGIPVCFVSYKQNFETLWPNLLTLLEGCPHLRIVITHGLYPPCLLQEDHSVVIPESALRLVCDYDVQLDVLPGLKEDQYGPDDVVIKTLFDTFGPSKLLWGSEFTKVNEPTVEQYSFQACYIEDRCPYMTKEDLHLIHDANARRVYGLS